MYNWGITCRRPRYHLGCNSEVNPMPLVGWWWEPRLRAHGIPWLFKSLSRSMDRPQFALDDIAILEDSHHRDSHVTWPVTNEKRGTSKQYTDMLVNWLASWVGSHGWCDCCFKRDSSTHMWVKPEDKNMSHANSYQQFRWVINHGELTPISFGGWTLVKGRWLFGISRSL